MGTVKCRYCHKDIDKNSAYNPAPRLYYCNQDHYDKHQKKKANYEKYMQKRYNQIPVLDSTEMTDTINYIKGTLGDINETMVKKQIEKLIESHHTYKGIELTIDYAVNILSLNLDPKYGVVYIVEKYYEDAKKYWIKKQRIRKKINEFNFKNEPFNIVKVKSKKNKLKDKLKVEEY